MFTIDPILGSTSSGNEWVFTITILQVDIYKCLAILTDVDAEFEQNFNHDICHNFYHKVYPLNCLFRDVYL